MLCPSPGLPGLPAADRTLVLGVVNVTPDSFSDGGRFFEPADAVREGLRLLQQGADVLDVGGESTRPGADRVDEPEERRRVLPVVVELVAAGAVVSVDTTRAGVAAAALDAGARLVNDVSGGADPAMFPLVAEQGVAYVLMHGRGPSKNMQSRAHYDDVVAEVTAELGQRLADARAAGVRETQVVLDPGLGFAKTAAHNWQLLASLEHLGALGRPLLVGTSRKTFLGRLLAAPDGSLRPPGERDHATAATSALAAAAGVWAVRVHDAGPNLDAVRVATAWRAASRTPAPIEGGPCG